jgi:hypothetical protein
VRSRHVLAISLWLICAVAGTAGAGVGAGSRPIWSQIKAFFACLVSRGTATEGGCELGHLVPGKVEPGARDVVVPIKKMAWQESLGGEEAAQPYIKARLTGWPRRLLVEKDSLPKTDDAFIARLARDTWAGLDALTDRESGLPVDNVRFGSSTAEAHVGDYTNVTTIGLHLIATVAAYDLDYITESQALDRIRRVLATLKRLETYKGFFFNYYDTTSLERTSNFLSFVDSSWLTAGLMVVRMTFPDLYSQCTELIARSDYRFFYDDTLHLMSHGYYVHRSLRSRYHYGVLYAESRLGSLIAIGKGDVPERHWFSMLRTFSPACLWQTQTPQGRGERKIAGVAVAGGYYEWKGLRYVPSWGGSMFEALMPTLVLDEAQYAPRSLGQNDEMHAVVQRRYALEELGYPVWGMSSSTTPEGGGYSEYGVRVLGSVGYKAGTITPHAAALALSVTPRAAAADLRRLVELYDIYGDYGFYDAVDPRSGQVARTYLGLDQSMAFIAMANYLNPHCIQKRFASDAITQKALHVIGEEDFFH